MALFSWVPLAVIDLLHDHLVSMSTPVFSLLSFPPISVFLYPLSLFCLLFFPTIPEWVLDCWKIYASALIGLAEVLPSFVMIDPSRIGLALVISGMVFAMLQFRVRFRWILFWILLFVIPCRFGFSSAPPTRVVQLNVGQGDATLLQRGGKTEFVDVGPEWGQSDELWFRRFCRYGVREIDAIHFTHGDQDHVGGLRYFQDRIKILEVGAASLFEMQTLFSHSSRAHGNQIMKGGIFWLNSNSVYINLGDADHQQEAQFLKHWHRSPGARVVLKLSHHGSKYSSSTEFLQQIHPDQVWVSVGAKNLYHHPHPETLSRLKGLKLEVLRTDRSGDLIWNAIDSPPSMRNSFF